MTKRRKSDISVIEAQTAVERVERLTGADLHDLCDAAEAAILEGGGFGWLNLPPRATMETYWKGVLLVPERELFVARLDKVIAGSAQLQRAARHNEAQAALGQISSLFLAPWSRGHGLAPLLVQSLEDAAREAGLRALTLDVRETQERAIEVYESLGFQQWGRNPYYAQVEGDWVAGLHYVKELEPQP